MQKIQIRTENTNESSADKLMYHITKARKESLDLERDICRSRDISFHVVPYKLKVKGSFNVVEKVLKQMLSSTPRVSTFAPSCRERPPSSARGRSLTRLFASSQPGEFCSSSVFVFSLSSQVSSPMDLKLTRMSLESCLRI